MNRINASMTTASIARHCEVDLAGREILARAVDRVGLSTRGLHRVLKVARTIADLAGSDRIESPHLEEAIHFRSERGV